MRSVDIKRKVDASICKSIHASRMVFAIIDGVNTDSIDAEFFESIRSESKRFQNW